MPIALSVEIVKDAATPEVDTLLAQNGVRYISQLSRGAFMLVRRATDLAHLQPESETVRFDDRAALVPKTVDFRILLTGRPLETPNERPALGYAQRAADRLGGLAVITTQVSNIKDVSSVTAHEMGHLLGLSYANENPHHCPNSTCLMFHATQYSTEPSENAPAHPLFKNRLYCRPCEEQVGNRTLRLMYRKKKDLL